MIASTIPSNARRLTDKLRASSEHGQVYAVKGQVHEQKETLQLVLEGAVLRQRFLGDGRTHTVAVYYRDDVINLMSYAGVERTTSDFLLAARGTVIGSVPDAEVARLRGTDTNRDGVGRLVYRELAIAHESALSLGQRTAAERMAHFFCETLLRCLVPMANERANSCVFEITQEMLSTILGLSTVHVNRTLQELRRLELATISGGRLVVENFTGLARMGEFDSAYLAPI